MMRLIRRRPSRSVQYSFDESCSYTGINHQISVLRIGLSIGSVSKVFKEEIFLEPSKLNLHILRTSLKQAEERTYEEFEKKEHYLANLVIIAIIHSSSVMFFES